MTLPARVTIICPIRNEEKYISACLDSLLDQTYSGKQLEILVVDGMSDDSTREIVGEYERKHPNIKMLDNADGIVPTALNIGIRAAAGEYILRMDGHAKADRHYVEQCVGFLKKGIADGVGGPVSSVNSTETGKAISLAMSSPFGVGNSRFRTSDDKECFVDTLAFAAYKRDVFSRYGLFDEELVRNQDDEYNFRIRKNGGRILLTPKIKSWYYPRSSFSKLWRQYFGYGFWKVRVLQKHFWMMQPRHFVPAGFVAALVGLLLVAWVFPTAIWGFALLITSYITASVLATVHTSRKDRSIALWRILVSFYLLHFSYGFGFLYGLIRFFPRWFERKEMSTNLTTASIQ